MIPMTCTCGKTIGVKDEHAGRRIRCPLCQTKIDVPIPELAGLVATGEGTAATPPPPPMGPAPVVPTVAERFDALERENAVLRRRCSRLRWGGIIGIAAAALVGMVPGWMALARPEPPSIAATVSEGVVRLEDALYARAIVARKLAIIDDAGAVRATLAPGEDQEVSLKLISNDQVRSEHRIWGNGIPSIVFYDEKDQERVILGGGYKESNAGLDLYDRTGSARVTFNVFPSGDPNLTFHDRHDWARLQVGVRHTDLGTKPTGVTYLDVFDRTSNTIPLLGEDGLPLVRKPPAP